MTLVFEVAAPPVGSDLQRADVACFIGYVARRPQRPLPRVLRSQLAAAGWLDGIWARPPAQVESLENLPIVLDGWSLFDWLFAWDQRPLSANGESVCTTYLGAAVRSFFARGGRRAIVVRVGDPWPYLESAGDRDARLRERLRRLVPAFAAAGAPPRPFEPHNPASWQGIHHLHGLRDTSMLLLPDLADACTVELAPPDIALPLAPRSEGFVECSGDEPVAPADRGLRRIPAPRLDSRGYAAWQLAMTAARDFLADPRNGHGVLLIAALPLPDLGARRVVGSGHVHAQSDLLAYLQRIGVLLGDGSPAPGGGAASAFVQLAWPWLRTGSSSDLPEALEPPDGALAGLVAAGAAERGTFRSVAGDFSLERLRDVTGAEPIPSWGLGDAHPSAGLARHLCVFAPLPNGWTLQSDVTTSPQQAWRFGGASRLMGTLVRAARAAGDALVFDANGPEQWAELRGTIEETLKGFWREGAFAAPTAAESFSVRCDRSTMTQNDLDNGRLVVEISVLPAASIDRITVVLNLGQAMAAREFEGGSMSGTAPLFTGVRCVQLGRRQRVSP